MKTMYFVRTAERKTVNDMLKRNEMIQDNRHAIRVFCVDMDKLIRKTKYLPLVARKEAKRALTDLHDFVFFMDPTEEDVVQIVHRMYPVIDQLTMEQEHLIDIESDTAESLTALVRNYI